MVCINNFFLLLHIHIYIVMVYLYLFKNFIIIIIGSLKRFFSLSSSLFFHVKEFGLIFFDSLSIIHPKEYSQFKNIFYTLITSTMLWHKLRLVCFCFCFLFSSVSSNTPARTHQYLHLIEKDKKPKGFSFHFLFFRLFDCSN